VGDGSGWDWNLPGAARTKVMKFDWRSKERFKKKTEHILLLEAGDSKDRDCGCSQETRSRIFKEGIAWRKRGGDKERGRGTIFAEKDGKRLTLPQVRIHRDEHGPGR